VERELARRERDSPFRVALITLDEEKKLPKYLTEVPAIDLVDNENIGATRICLSSAAEFYKLAGAKLEAEGRRAISLNEVLVRIRLVKLNVG